LDVFTEEHREKEIISETTYMYVPVIQCWRWGLLGERGIQLKLQFLHSTSKAKKSKTKQKPGPTFPLDLSLHIFLCKIKIKKSNLH
jgi:hypothetical protein